MARTVSDALTAMGDQVLLEQAERYHRRAVSRGARRRYASSMELHAVFESDENGWVRATIEELPSVVTCAPTIDEARLLVRDALAEWLQALTTTERGAIPGDATRETLTLNVA
jgi:predicted RNase H-like HicB family nuclease